VRRRASNELRPAGCAGVPPELPAPRRRTWWSLVPYVVFAGVLGFYLQVEQVPDAPLVAGAVFVLLAVLGEAYRSLSWRLGHLTALAAVCVASGAFGGLLAVLGVACSTGSCTPSQTGTAITTGLLTPVTIWVLFAPPVVAWRLLRRLWRSRRQLLSTLGITSPQKPTPPVDRTPPESREASDASRTEPAGRPTQSRRRRAR